MPVLLVRESYLVEHDLDKKLPVHQKFHWSKLTPSLNHKPAIGYFVVVRYRVEATERLRANYLFEEEEVLVLPEPIKTTRRYTYVVYSPNYPQTLRELDFYGQGCGSGGGENYCAYAKSCSFCPGNGGFCYAEKVRFVWDIANERGIDWFPALGLLLDRYGPSLPYYHNLAFRPVVKFMV